MPLPWVSRELYNVVCGQLKEAESERKQLLDRLIGMPDPVEAIASALPSPDSKDAADLLDATTGELTGAKIRQAAQRAAFERAGRPVR